ncbi:MAG: hypothetical protein KDD64_12250, partial [Bdellovibrionales bacterium]|nr:hypothetical protein [Bdellovibrionales bacterium]
MAFILKEVTRECCSRILSHQFLVRAVVLFLVSNVALADSYSVVARKGTPATGTALSGSNFYHLSNTSTVNIELPIITGQGTIVFEALLSGNGLTVLNDNAVFAQTPNGELQLLAQEGTSFLNNQAQVSLNGFSTFDVGKTDEISFISPLSGSGVTGSNINSTWVASGGQVRLAVRDGVSGFGQISQRTLQSSQELLSFRSTVPGYSGYVGYWLPNYSPTAPYSPTASELGKTGSPAPGCPEAFFGTDLRLHTSGSGTYLLASSLFGAGATNGTSSGLWEVNSSESVELMLRAGMETAPGSGSFFSTFVGPRRSPVINANGTYAFTATLAGSDTRTSLFRVREHALARVISTGESAPEAGTNVVFASIDPTWTGQNISISDDPNDGIALYATLAGPGIDATNDRSLWIFGGDGNRTLVMQGGQQIGGTPYQIINSSIGTLLSFNASEELAFRASLSGVETPSQIPVPSAEAILKFSRAQLAIAVRQYQQFEESKWIVRVDWLPEIQLNDLGQIVFTGTVGTQISDLSGTPALFRIGRNNLPSVVAVAGMPVEAVSGEHFSLSSNGWSTSASLSDTGDITFLALATFGEQVVFRVSIEDQELFDGPISDFNHDGIVTQQDLFDFLEAFFAQSQAADVDHSGIVSIQDLFNFLNDWFEHL